MPVYNLLKYRSKERFINWQPNKQSLKQDSFKNSLKNLYTAALSRIIIFMFTRIIFWIAHINNTGLRKAYPNQRKLLSNKKGLLIESWKYENLSNPKLWESLNSRIINLENTTNIDLSYMWFSSFQPMLLSVTLHCGNNI